LRILQVIHQFPPYSSQGSEVYCYNLAKKLRENDDCRVFHISNNSRRWPRRLRRATYEGLPTYHCGDGGEYARLADWRNDFLSTSFQAVLDDFAPEVVHFHHFLSLGDDLVSRACASKAGVVYTLHDYGLICPNRLLLQDGGKLCDKDNADFFQDCCPIWIRSNGDDHARPWNAYLPSLAQWRLYARQHPNSIARALLMGFIQFAERLWGDPKQTDFAGKRDFFLTHTRRIFRDVDLFLAPSEFLLRKYVNAGLPAHKVIHSTYGMRLPEPRSREKWNGIRFGYIGAFHAHKGIDLLLKAFRGLEDRAALHVYGSVFGSPISKSYWQRIRSSQTANVTFHGAYDNDKVDTILATVDAIVVPSLWYENSPLTIHEAFAAGVPVITADVGGMTELVHHNVNGLNFRLGDAKDLREKLIQIIEHPEVLEHLKFGIPKVKNIEQDAAQQRTRYRKLLRLRSNSAPNVEMLADFV
jgi:glycosyltransferase involved in cell wall biosynthesis